MNKRQNSNDKLVFNRPRSSKGHRGMYASNNGNANQVVAGTGLTQTNSVGGANAKEPVVGVVRTNTKSEERPMKSQQQ